MTTLFVVFRIIFVFILCSFVLTLVLLAAVYVLSFTSKVDLEKSSVFYSRFQPFPETRVPFEVQFAVIAIMFLLFDIEVLYLFPLISTLFFMHLSFVCYYYSVSMKGPLFEISRRDIKKKKNASREMTLDSYFNYKENLLLHVPRSKTKTSVPVKFNQISKHCFGTSSHFGIRGLKTINPQQLIEQKKIMLNKAIFFKYCDHFKQHSLTSLLNDSFFIKMMHDHIHKEPTVYSRAFQLALEVTYSKRHFSQQDLQEFYKNDFSISDHFNVNNGLCDQSTLFTSMSTKFLVDYLNLDKKDVIVTTTPLYLTKDRITKSIRETMDYNKKMTDNTAPDISVKERPFDFKDSKDICFNKNHIYILDESLFTENGLRLLHRLQQSLQGSLQQKMNKDVELFTRGFIRMLQEQQDLPIKARLDNINAFLVKSNVPKEFKSPFIILKRKIVIEELIPPGDRELIEKVPLDNGHLDYVKAKKAIEGILDEYRDQSLRDKIMQATRSSIRFDKYHEEVD